MDNASYHPKKKLANLARRHGMSLLFLPIYSPDFNPMEHDWANMKRALVDNMLNMENLEEGIYCYFGVVVKLIDYMTMTFSLIVVIILTSPF